MKEGIYGRIDAKLKKRFQIRCLQIEKRQEEVLEDLIRDFLVGKNV